MRMWVASGAVVAVLAFAAALGLARRAAESRHLSPAMVTGRAAAAIGDSGVFAMRNAPLGVRPVLALADVESAAVAMAYWYAPARQAVRERHVVELPTERRHVCGPLYYVRSVVALPDTVVTRGATTNPTMAWGPAWVVPVCDDTRIARTTVIFADAPTGLRVVLGDQPGDVPELVFPRDGFGHIGTVPNQLSRDWEFGIALTPEAAVAFVAARLAGTGARVAEVPEAFRIVLLRPPPPNGSDTLQVFPQTHACPRWRLTLDQAVTLRGIESGQVVRSRTVYVTRGENGCDGAAALQFPLPSQPRTLPFWYGVRRERSRPVPQRGPLPADVQPREERSSALRVTEPIWFERARHAPTGKKMP